ncbi:MAG: TetR/AcrR family transcriptional regulator [Pseudomonadota bacterium]
MSQQDASGEGKRQQAAAKRRAMILDAAVLCFIEQGYHQSGVRDIAKRAGVSLGNLYNHFPGKHDMLAEIAAVERSELEPFLALLEKPQPAQQILDRFVSRYVRYIGQAESVILSIEITSEAIRKPDIGELFLQNRNQLVTALDTFIQRGVAEGAFRTLKSTKETAHLIVELIEGTAYRSVLSETAIRKLLPTLKDFISTSLQAI